MCYSIITLDCVCLFGSVCLLLVNHVHALCSSPSLRGSTVLTHGVSSIFELTKMATHIAHKVEQLDSRSCFEFWLYRFMEMGVHSSFIGLSFGWRLGLYLVSVNTRGCVSHGHQASRYPLKVTWPCVLSTTAWNHKSDVCVCVSRRLSVMQSWHPRSEAHP